MTAGDTFFILAPRRDDHLWMVISDPARDPGRVVVVCFLSLKEHTDQTCILDVADHPAFIKHPTCVQYEMARVTTDATLERMCQNREIQLRTPLSPATLARIRKGAGDSSDIRNECYGVLRDQGFVP